MPDTALTPTRDSVYSSAELCRRNGWTVGTALIGDEGYGPAVIVLTAIGKRNVLAQQISPIRQDENVWTLRNRDWRPT